MRSLLPATDETEGPDPKGVDDMEDSEQFEEEDHALYGSAFPEQTA